ncbi:contactin-3-like [Diadema setosum]|uniref:contactin-3-like n=1 Tax=Diadema setosum TaxID=31175 RepID=UPI003B3A5052
MATEVKLFLFLLLLTEACGLLQFTLTPSDQAVLLNQGLWWHCTARASIGSPEPTYSWVHDNEAVVGEEGPAVFSNGTLYIERVTRELLGIYRCRVESGVESLESPDVKLALASLGISFLSSPVSVTQNLGSALMLHCSIVSVPMATIMWQINGEDVGAADVITTTESGSITSSSLQIDTLNHQHGGQVRCLATNSLLSGLTRYSQPATISLIGRPGFSTTPVPVTVILGGTATFSCEANGSPASTMDWLNPEGNVITTAGRFTATVSRLTITNTQQTDSGYYTCRASNTWGENTASALLTVGDPSQQIIFTTLPSDQTETVGGRVTFPCGATGNPTPAIKWTKEGGSLPMNRVQEPAAGWLRITSLHIDDSGFYICSASNSLTSVSTRVQLVVQVEPNITVVPEDTIVEEGETALLQCAADGVPAPDITWTTPLPDLGVVRFSDGERFAVEVLSNGSLVVHGVEIRHAGTYVCSAANTVTSTSRRANLVVRSSPVIIMSPMDQTAIEGDITRFQCRAAATPTPVISWLFGGQSLSTDFKYEVLGNGDLRINNVEESQEGTYTCSAENTLGTKTASAYFTVYVPPQFIIHPIDITIFLGSEVRLDCQASGDPTPTIQWQKDGSPLVLENNIELLSNSSVVISDLRETNTGEYTCLASNQAGSKLVSATVSTPDFPEFSISPSNTTGNETHPVSISCRATARETPTISWYLSDAAGSQGDQIGLGTNPPATRGQLSYVAVSGDLQFSQVVKRDEGWYLCVAENTAGSISGSAFLSVNVPPQATAYTTPVQTVEGSSYVLLSCSFSGQPKPRVIWFLPSGQSLPHDPRLYSETVTGDRALLAVYNPLVASHDGHFVCTASNFLGTSNATVQLIVEGVPAITSVQAIPSDTSVSLRCDTKGMPAPTISWSRDGTVLPDPSVPDHILTPEGTLTITNLAAASSSVYTCTAVNSHGSVSGTLQAPSQMSVPFITAIGPRSVQLSLATPASGDLPITGFVVQYQMQGSEEYLFGGETSENVVEVSGLEPHTGYMLRSQAVNGLGMGPFSPTTSLVYTSEDAPSSPREVEAVASGNLVTVSWTVPISLNGDPDNIIYEVFFYPLDAPSETGTVVVSHSTGQLSAILTDLQYTSDYEVKVRAGNRQLQDFSSYSTILVRTGTQAPQQAVQEFHAVANSSSSLWLTWKPTEDPTFEAYLIFFRELNSSDMTPDVVLTAQAAASYLIVGLEAAMPYVVRMAYQNAGGLSPFTPEVIVSTQAEPAAGGNQARRVNGGIVAAIVIAILAIILIIALVAVGCHWKRKNEEWSGQSHFNVDSLWINRRGGSQKGVYDLSIVNDNFAPDETGLSSDSAYDLGGRDGVGEERTGSTEVSPRSETSDGDKKKKRRKWRGLSDVIYKNPDNPGVVLVSKAMIGDTYPPPVAVNNDEVLSEDEADVSIPSPLSIPMDSATDNPDISYGVPAAKENLYVEIGESSTATTNAERPQSTEADLSGPTGEFLVFPNADDSIKLSEELHVDPRLMRKMERKAERDQEKKARKKARQEEKEKEKEREREEKKRERMFGSNMPGRLSKLFKSGKADEIPYPQSNFAFSTDRQVENAGMF